MSVDADPPDTRTDMERAAAAFAMLAMCVRFRGRRLDRAYRESRYRIVTNEKDQTP